MEFRLESTDGLAQKGIILHNKSKISTPNIIFTPYNDISPPDEASLVLIDKTKDCFNPFYQISTNNKKKQDENILFTIEKPLFYPKIIPKKIHETINDSYSIDEKSSFVLSGKIIEKDKEKLKNIQLFIISHGLQLYNNPVDFIEYLQKLRLMISPDQLIYLPGVANPRNLSVLIHLGVDLIDSTQAIIAARDKILFFPEGNKKISTLNVNPCQCPICMKHKHNPSKLTFHDIFLHNYQMMMQEMHTVHNAIKQESLREHVSIRISNSPHLTSIIRLAEIDQFNIVEQKTPRNRNTIIQATNIDSLQRPEIKGFQQRLLNRYIKPENTSILLLLPCSAKKPYSFSKSHNKLIKAIQSIPNHYCIHELIITSPVGIVPRELELMYPASSYDIPVTGNWFEDEQKMIINLLQQYLLKNHYNKIIVHLPEPLNKLITTHIPNTLSTNISSSATTKDALDNLVSTLKEETIQFEKISGKQRFKDNMFSLTSFQFSEKISKQLLKNTNIKGKYPFLKIIDTNYKQLGMLTDKRGMISLTLDGAERISSCHQFYVEISNDFTLKGSVFSPGVIHADPSIRKGDEVLVFQNKILKGVGVAQMNGSDMIQRMSGKAIDIRHTAD